MTNIYKMDLDKVHAAHSHLSSHPLLNLNHLQSLDDVRKFMESHVYAVLDFMSLLKYLQNRIAPTSFPWTQPREFSPKCVRLINEIVLCEESDLTPVEGEYMSHFDLYITAMKEIGADISPVLRFVQNIENRGFEYALDSTFVPPHAKTFMKRTMSFINTDEPHIVASAFTFGRERIIPQMFKLLLRQLEINETSAPYFHFYLERHIQVDGDEHGPAALEILETLCGGDPLMVHQAEKAALDAIQARYDFWTAVEKTVM